MVPIRVFDRRGLGVVVPDDRVPCDPVTARGRLEEWQQGRSPIEPVQERIEVLHVLGETVADRRRVASWFVRYVTSGPVGSGPINNGEAIGVQLIR